VNGIEKKEKQRRQRLSEKYTALMLLIPNRTKVITNHRFLFLVAKKITIIDRLL
jgi:hypothetical protein